MPRASQRVRRGLRSGGELPVLGPLFYAADESGGFTRKWLVFLTRFRVKKQYPVSEAAIIGTSGEDNEHSSIISSEAMDIERFFSGKADFLNKKTGILIFYTKTGLKIPPFCVNIAAHHRKRRNYRE